MSAAADVFPERLVALLDELVHLEQDRGAVSDEHARRTGTACRDAQRARMHPAVKCGAGSCAYPMPGEVW